MKAEVYKVYLQDDCPRLPCGWRYLIVQIGRKWVYIRDYDKFIHDENTHRARIRRSTWDKLKAEPCASLNDKVKDVLNQ